MPRLTVQKTATEPQAAESTAPNAEGARRIARLRQDLRRRGLDAMIVFDRANTFYLTGMRCSLSYLFVPADAGLPAVLAVDGRYYEAARATVSHCSVRLMTELRKTFQEWRREARPRRMGFEGGTAWSTVRNWQELMGEAAQGDGSVEWEECGELIRQQRLIKSAVEARLIERSAHLNDAVYEQALLVARPGATEIDLRNAIRNGADLVGADGLSFETIAASGAMSSRPHYVPQTRPLSRGDLLLIDMGLLVDGYCSDMTRVVGLGQRPSARLMRVYEAVLAAQQAALDAVGPGVACAELDRIARESLKARRLAQYFTHGLGHGVGLEIHEAPTLNSRSQEVLRPGMVVTIEPGVYLPGLGGVRIEDLVLVTRTGRRVLSRTPKEFRLLAFEP